MKMKNGIFLCLVITSAFGFLLGQEFGVISGKVYDKGSGDTLVGASLHLEGSDSVVFTDINGDYVFSQVPVGIHQVSASFTGYSKVTIAEIEVKSGEEKNLNFELSAAVFEAEMVVTAELISTTEAGLLKHRQRSISITDAISGDEISRSGGSSAADAVTKITGASVVGGKYVFIRGLGDRYTSTHLNGVEMPTSDPDTNSFQADLFPSSILDNVVTLKSFTPDKPGNFSGGIVDIGTKEYPKRFTVGVSLKGSTNSVATGNDDYLSYNGSSTDWLGRDDGLRGLPALVQGPNLQIPTITSARNNPEQAQLLDRVTRAFNPQMSATRKSAPVNRGMAFSIGDKKSLFGKKFGYIASLTYNRKYSYLEDWRTARWKLTENVATANTLLNQSDFSGNQGKDKVTWGGLISTSFIPAPTHELSFNLVYTQSGESRSDYYLGHWPEQFASESARLESRLLKYTERNLTSYQIKGDHYFTGLRGLTLDWTASLSSTLQDEPDTRIFTDNFSTRQINGEEVTFYSITTSNYNAPARYFRELEEDGNAFTLNAEMPFSQWNQLPGNLKVGFSYDKKDRTYFETRYEYDSRSNVRYNGDPEFFFGPDNVGILGFDENTNRTIFGNVIQLSPDPQGGNYQGESEVTAFYGMLELPISLNLKLITGGRFEQADFNVFNHSTRGTLDDDDFLPSLHFIYTLMENMNLRTSFGRTLARPTFREKAPYASFDFIVDGIFRGNPDLQRTLIDNYDLRWEWFPYPGEIMAASVFYKTFENPIERTYIIQADFGETIFKNVPEATVSGVELEFRKVLTPRAAVRSISVASNVSFINSEVDRPADELEFLRLFDPDASATRKLQGQSPFLVNVGLNYDNFNSDTSASLYFNVFGERLDEVGVGGAPDAFEQPREVLDFTFSQKFLKNLTFKFVAKNLLDKPVEITQTFKGLSFVRSSYHTGRDFSISISYKP